MLHLETVHTFYGNIEALKGVSVDVEQGQIVTIIGSNGAGKSTLLMTICGSPKAARGRVMFEGQDISRLATYDIVKLGISQSPEGRRIFPRLTVLENLEMGAYLRRDRSRMAQDLERVFELFPVLKERVRQMGGTLSGGEQQMLAIGRALMSRPTLLMMDEPTMGIAPILVSRIFAAVRRLRDEGLTVLLVEQNARAALRLSSRGYVLETGRVVLSDAAESLLGDRRVQEAYLGDAPAPGTGHSPQGAR